MTKPTIYFRADGNTKIGLGHVIRSLALADMLAANFECIFLVQAPTATLVQEITSKYQLITLPAQENYLNEAHNITEKYLNASQTIVLDGYNFKTEYQKIIKSSGCRLVCIDDLHAWHFVADIIINHAEGLNPSDYACEPYTKLCLGLRYTLLRQPFLEAARQNRKISQLEKVFICFGGSDIHNLSKNATEACLSIDTLQEVHVVLGAAYASYDDFCNHFRTSARLHIHQNLSAQAMCQLMQSCDIGIASASSISYELLATGLIWLGGYYVDNQLSIYHGFKNLGCLYDLGDLRVELINKIKNQVNHLKTGNFTQVIDGQSPERILKILQENAHTNIGR